MILTYGVFPNTVRKVDVVVCYAEGVRPEGGGAGTGRSARFGFVSDVAAFLWLVVVACFCGFFFLFSCMLTETIATSARTSLSITGVGARGDPVREEHDFLILLVVLYCLLYVCVCRSCLLLSSLVLSLFIAAGAAAAAIAVAVLTLFVFLPRRERFVHAFCLFVFFLPVVGCCFLQPSTLEHVHDTKTLWQALEACLRYDEDCTSSRVRPSPIEKKLKRD